MDLFLLNIDSLYQGTLLFFHSLSLSKRLNTLHRSQNKVIFVLFLQDQFKLVGNDQCDQMILIYIWQFTAIKKLPK